MTRVGSKELHGLVYELSLFHTKARVALQKHNLKIKPERRGFRRHGSLSLKGLRRAPPEKRQSTPALALLTATSRSAHSLQGVPHWANRTCPGIFLTVRTGYRVMTSPSMMYSKRGSERKGEGKVRPRLSVFEDIYFAHGFLRKLNLLRRQYTYFQHLSIVGDVTVKPLGAIQMPHDGRMGKEPFKRSRASFVPSIRTIVFSTGMGLKERSHSA